MQFTSVLYLGFFCAAFALYYICPQRFKWGVLLLASLIFYSLFGFGMLAILCICTVVSFVLGLLTSQKKRGKLWLFFIVTISLTPLLFFKYADSALLLFGQESFFSRLTPLGLSFFTFKIIAYLVDVYKGNITACKHFGKYAVYVTFFTQITSGPIQRPKELLEQIENPIKKLDYNKAVNGARLVLFGLFKKLLIADALSKHIIIGFESHFVITGPAVILAAVLYSVQIYCDFSGYSDISIGCMNLLGFDVAQNFNSPYFSTSIKDFWARWHISLSTFLRDYVYFPLGGSRRGKVRTYVNIMLTFLISGIWHGTGFQFIVWGLLHGVFQVVGRLTSGIKSTALAKIKLKESSFIVTFCKIVITFVLVTCAWVFFGASSLQQALGMFKQMPVGFSLSQSSWLFAVAVLGFENFEIIRILMFTALAMFIDFKCKDKGFVQWVNCLKPPVRLALCYVLLFAVIIYAPLGATSFIYFQF